MEIEAGSFGLGGYRVYISEDGEVDIYKYKNACKFTHTENIECRKLIGGVDAMTLQEMVDAGLLNDELMPVARRATKRYYEKVAEEWSSDV